MSTEHENSVEVPEDALERAEEFGRPASVQFIDTENKSETPSASSSHLSLVDNLFQRRRLQQYWLSHVLFRSSNSRAVTSDELFLDLVIVGAVASLGHALRDSLLGWRSIEAFLLLFGAVYNAWRNIMLLWNLWGAPGDLASKIGIYVVFVFLIYIGLGSRGAFSDENVRPFIAVASWLSCVIPALGSVLLGLSEPLLLLGAKGKRGQNRKNYVHPFFVVGCFWILSYTPYLAAAFVTHDTPTRVLYWIGFGSGMLTQYVAGAISSAYLRPRDGTYSKVLRTAINIELYVEKYNTLTMIVLGESVIGILFEGAELAVEEGARVRAIFGMAAMGCLILYAFQTLYINVDAHIAEGGIHAVIYRKRNAILWTLLHVPYHAALVFVATGIGIAMRDIAIPPSSAADEMEEMGERIETSVFIRADDENGGGEISGNEEEFGNMVRWVFSSGWGIAMVFSVLIAMMHKKGLKEPTKVARFVARCVIAIPIMIGMPFADISALNFMVVYVVGSGVLALTEFVLVQMDNVDFFVQDKEDITGLVDVEANEDGEEETGDELEFMDNDELKETIRERMQVYHRVPGSGGGNNAQEHIVTASKRDTRQQELGGFDFG